MKTKNVGLLVSLGLLAIVALSCSQPVVEPVPELYAVPAVEQSTITEGDLLATMTAEIAEIDNIVSADFDSALADLDATYDAEVHATIMGELESTLRPGLFLSQPQIGPSITASQLASEYAAD